MRNQDPVEVAKEKAIFAYNYVLRQAREALALANERGILQDRDVQIAAGGFLAGWLVLSFGVGFGLAVGYLAYHYIRCDDRVAPKPEKAAPPKKVG